MSKIKDVVKLLEEIYNDDVSENVKKSILEIITVLKEKDWGLGVKIDKSMQRLDNLSNNPEIPSFIKTKLWNIVSMLESI